MNTEGIEHHSASVPGVARLFAREKEEHNTIGARTTRGACEAAETAFSIK